MKIHLPTAILLALLIAVCAGWFLDRRSQSRGLSPKTTLSPHDAEYIYVGSSAFASAGRAFDILETLADDPEHREYLQTELVSEFLNVYENQAAIEFSGRLVIGEFDARCLARDALHRLDCETTDHFFKIARSLPRFENPEYYPELHDLKSSEFKSLHEFVSDTIAVKDQMYVRGFENDPRN